MREIKFRAWDKISGKVRIIDSIAFDKQGKIKVINVWGYNVIGQKEIIIHLSNKKELERIVLMQYTGLRDKNGKEIYEGDVVRSADGYITAVVKIGGCYPVAIKKFCELMGIREHSTYCLHAYDKYGEYLIEDNKTLEIIGNIYENPELLEGNND